MIHRKNRRIAFGNGLINRPKAGMLAAFENWGRELSTTSCSHTFITLYYLWSANKHVAY